MYTHRYYDLICFMFVARKASNARMVGGWSEKAMPTFSRGRCINVSMLVYQVVVAFAMLYLG